MTLGTLRILKLERGNTRLRSVENLLRKRVWNCRKTDWGLVTMEEQGVHRYCRHIGVGMVT
jgi:hypothetical protein